MNRIALLLLTLLLCGCQRQQAGLSDYHEALALMEQGDAPAALQKLETAGRKATTDSLRALVESQKGTLYFSQRLLDRSLESYRQAYAIDLRARDTVGLIYDLRDIGNVLRATAEGADSCYDYFERARQLAIATANRPMQRDVESQMAAYHLSRNQLEEARRLLMPALQYVDSTNQSALYYMMGDLYRREGQTDSATHYYRLLLAHGNVYGQQAAHRALAEYCMAAGDNAAAADHLRQYELLTDSVHQQNDAEAVRHVAALYDYTRHEQEAHRLSRRLMLTVGALTMAVLLFVVFLLYVSRRRLHYRLKVQRLEQLLERYRQQQSPPASDHPIVGQIERLIAATPPQPMTTADWQQLEEAIEQQHPHFINRVQEFCRLSPQERRVCLLLKLNISPVNIALLTAHSKQSVTNTRSRLYQKAFGTKGTPAQWDEFIMSL